MHSSNQKKVIIIAGPTAVGKTAVAIRLAQHFNTEIISADSRQCYREMKIGVARPSEKELSIVPHHFIASHSIRDEVNAAAFASFALEKANELFKMHDTIIMVGGTGLYIKAFTEGLDEIPSISQEVREKIIDQYEKNGIQWLQEEIKIKDPEFFRKGEIQNPHRLIRALEVREGTGKSILDFRKGETAQRNFQIKKFVIDLPGPLLRERIDQRVDQMMKDGLLDEVNSLLPYKNLKALQTVGYQELFNYLENKISLEEAVERIKIHTRQYAKRQKTWFRREEGFEWKNAYEFDDVMM